MEINFSYLPMRGHEKDPYRHEKPVWCVVTKYDDRTEYPTAPDLNNLAMEKAEQKAAELNKKNRPS